MNHKRGKHKSARAGCLMCKSWKGVGNNKNRFDTQKTYSDKRRNQSMDDQESFFYTGVSE